MKEQPSYPLSISTKEALKEIARGVPALLKLFYRLLRDTRTPRGVKWWIGGSALYLILPFNLKFRKLKTFPLQLLNYVDDVLLIFHTVQRVMRDTPTELLEEHWEHERSLGEWRDLLFKIKIDLQNIF
ncbi:MAG: hypothetical protein WC372_00330 [Candidatus Neomarinimicrobiota bacterium]|jgi:uncharacterized membrane protein YkvA (DUF1232 family)|nr:hypothetical protein [Candidatus Neomarinimicrobiota bacterium]MDX9779436.1 hypothetical protein [bacterium]